MSFQLCPEEDALFLDIDGTLLDIAPTPDGVRVPPELREHLKRLHERMDGALALISGRTLSEIDALFSPLRLPASGAHGAEWRIGEEKSARDPLPEEIRREILASFAAFPAVLVEDKTYSMAVHYRKDPALATEVEKSLRSIVSASKQPLSVMAGKMVFEVVYPWHNKGAALEHFMSHRPFLGRRPVFLGDDETDLYAIRTCKRMGGMADHVGRENCIFSSPGEVRAWLAEVA